MDAIVPRAANGLRRAWEPIYWRLQNVLLALTEGSRLGLVRLLEGPLHIDRVQATLTWEVPLPECRSPSELARWLQSRGVVCEEGLTVLYVPPQQSLHRVLPEIAAFYPPNSGFKILRSFGNPAEARYSSARSLEFILGNPLHRVLTANYLFTKALGVRLWDLCCWRAGKHTYTVFVVNHARGGTPTIPECEEFLRSLDRVLSERILRVAQAKWRTSGDFRCPECEENLKRTEPGEAPRYVDFENFYILRHSLWPRLLRFEAERLLHEIDGGDLTAHRHLIRRTSALLSALSGEKSAEWRSFVAALDQTGLRLAGRLILDLSSTPVTVLEHALGSGASWAVGWSPGYTLSCEQEALFSRSCTRFDLVERDREVDGSVAGRVPIHLGSRLSEAVLFFTGGPDTEVLLRRVEEIPWRAMLYASDAADREPEILSRVEPLVRRGYRPSFCTSSPERDAPLVLCLMRQ